MNTACSRKGENKIVMQWENSLLLPGCTGMLKNVGLAGAYSGIVEDKLLVLGGANFPDKYPWEGGVKTWWSTLYSYDLHMDHASFRRQCRTGRGGGADWCDALA